MKSLKLKTVKLNPNQCWEWIGNLTEKGYGQMRINGVTFSAHRLSWLLFHGGGQNNFQVLHKCDNRKCFNPNHLFLGTNADNVKDRNSKNRQAKGANIRTTKLSKANVRLIRLCFSKGINKAVLARKFKVNYTTILAIVNRKTWKHI